MNDEVRQVAPKPSRLRQKGGGCCSINKAPEMGSWTNSQSLDGWKLNRPKKKTEKKVDQTQPGNLGSASLPSLSVHVKAISKEWWSADAGHPGCFDACNSNMEPLKSQRSCARRVDVMPTESELPTHVMLLSLPEIKMQGFSAWLLGRERGSQAPLHCIQATANQPTRRPHTLQAAGYSPAARDSALLLFCGFLSRKSFA